MFISVFVANCDTFVFSEEGEVLSGWLPVSLCAYLFIYFVLCSVKCVRNKVENVQKNLFFCYADNGFVCIIVCECVVMPFPLDCPGVI